MGNTNQGELDKDAKRKKLPPGERSNCWQKKKTTDIKGKGRLREEKKRDNHYGNRAKKKNGSRSAKESGEKWVSARRGSAGFAGRRLVHSMKTTGIEWGRGKGAKLSIKKKKWNDVK